MTPFRRLAHSSLLGLVLGLSILGVGGRVLMRLIAYLAQHAPGFSVGGSLEVVATGGIFGTLGGFIYPFLARMPLRFRPAALAITLFAVIALTSTAARSAAASVPEPRRVPALLFFALLLLGYTYALHRLQLGDRSRPAAS